MQSRLMSLLEAVANVLAGYGVAVATQQVVFPWFGLSATVADSLAMGAIFTLVSIVRSLFYATSVRTASDARIKTAFCPPPRALSNRSGE